MDKIQELNHIITEYGYLAIFLFVFLQELGIPNPITNELVLICSGYLTYIGTLNITKVIAISVSADFIGTSILYFVFYGLNKYLISISPSNWLAKFAIKIDKFSQRLDKENHLGIFIGRLTPFLRGYVSVAAGILRIRPKIFLTNVLFSAIVWSGGLVMVGVLLGPYWNNVVQKIGYIPFAGLIIILVIAIFFAGRFVVNREVSKTKKTDTLV